MSFAEEGGNDWAHCSWTGCENRTSTPARHDWMQRSDGSWLCGHHAKAARGAPLLTGVLLIAAERTRQVDQEGYSTEHDDRYTGGELADAAAAYTQALLFPRPTPHLYWPWAPEDWKPSTDQVKNLVRAGALIAAEIDRILRLREKP